MDNQDYIKQINEFEARYDYDCDYMREMLQLVPAAYMKFNNFMALVDHRTHLDKESYWLGKVVTMCAEDCGDCLQLNVRMAIEDGVSPQLVLAASRDEDKLPKEWRDLYRFIKQIADNELQQEGLIQNMNQRYTRQALIELGLCMATATVFPRLKRAMGYGQTCNVLVREQ